MSRLMGFFVRKYILVRDYGSSWAKLKSKMGHNGLI